MATQIATASQEARKSLEDLKKSFVSDSTDFLDAARVYFQEVEAAKDPKYEPNFDLLLTKKEADFLGPIINYKFNSHSAPTKGLKFEELNGPDSQGDLPTRHINMSDPLISSAAAKLSVIFDGPDVKGTALKRVANKEEWTALAANITNQEKAIAEHAANEAAAKAAVADTTPSSANINVDAIEAEVTQVEQQTTPSEPLVAAATANNIAVVPKPIVTSTLTKHEQKQIRTIVQDGQFDDTKALAILAKTYGHEFDATKKYKIPSADSKALVAALNGGKDIEETVAKVFANKEELTEISRSTIVDIHNIIAKPRGSLNDKKLTNDDKGLRDVVAALDKANIRSTIVSDELAKDGAHLNFVALKDLGKLQKAISRTKDYGQNDGHKDTLLIDTKGRDQILAALSDCTFNPQGGLTKPTDIAQPPVAQQAAAK